MAQSVSAAAQAMKEALADSVRKRALWFIVQGVLMAIAGLVAIAFPLVSSITAIVIIGWLLIVSGIIQAIALIGARDAPHFWMQLMSVALAVIIGVMLLAHPGQGLVLLTIMVIVFFFVEGMAKIVFALMVRPLPNWVWVLASGAATMILAMVLWSMLPLSAAWLIGLFLGVTLISQGVALAYFAWTLRQQQA